MKPLLRTTVLLASLVLLAAFSGCGAGSYAAEPQMVEVERQMMREQEVFTEAAADAPLAMGKEVIREMESVVEKSVVVEKGVVVEKEVVKEVEAAKEAMVASADGHRESGEDSASRTNTSAAAQNRIIVHTAHAVLVVDDVAGAIDQVDALARESGGWVVGSDRSSRHSGYISIRVPAAMLNQIIKQLESMAIEVESMALSSQDVTDEYVDSQSRLTSLRATEEVLLKLLGQAAKVEDALKVQNEITRVQSQIEAIQGRIKFLEETAAFSLINISLRLTTADMRVDAGGDTAFRVGRTATFRATFYPPSEMEDFTFTWDFGDGATAFGSGTAPTTNPGERVTGSVSHVYEEEGDYVVEVTINGSGDTGLAEGSDSLVASVTRIPDIEVFAGESRVVEEGEEVEYTASFTRPEELWDYEFRWDFGDGTPTVIGTPEQGVTRVSALHSFADYRPFPYEVKFTLTAMSEAGEVTGFDITGVHVTESIGYFVGGWDAGETGKSAIRALSVVVTGAATLIIWLGIFIPVWVVIGAIVVLFIVMRRRGNIRLPGFPRLRRRGRRRAVESPAPEATATEGPPDGPAVETEEGRN